MAAEARAAAQARFEQQEKRLAALEREIAAIRAGIKQEAEAEKARLIAMAEDRARASARRSEFIIEQQVKQAEEDLRREVAAQAVAMAEEIVRAQLGAQDQQRLSTAFVGDVAGNGAHAAAPPRVRGPSERAQAKSMRWPPWAVRSPAATPARSSRSASTHGNFEALGEELDELASLYDESRELRQALENPVFKPSEKRAVAGERAAPGRADSPRCSNFALLLLDRRRIVHPAHDRARLPGADRRARSAGCAPRSTSAEPLTRRPETGSSRALERRTGKKVLIKTEVDPDLIGGVVARVGDLVLDGSLRTRLADRAATELVN